MTTAHIGTPADRVDGPAKVTGRAKYAAEFPAPDLAHGVVVSSAFAKGKITRIDTAPALAVPGVFGVFTHENRPRTAWFDSKWKDETAPPGSPFRPLYDEQVRYSGQPVALVVAETFEAARYAATLVRIEYRAEPHETDLRAKRADARVPAKYRDASVKPAPRGDADAALAGSAVTIDAEYTVPVEHHNPMECHATTVVRAADGKLTVHDKTQGAPNSHKYVCNVFGYAQADVRVVAPFVGGAFGSGLRPQYQLFLAVMAAHELKRSVRVSLTRQQMFTFGHRPNTLQRVVLGADPDGTLNAIVHEAVGETSRFEDFTENVVNWSGLLYQCDNVKPDYRLAPLDLYTPMDMRAPGATLGVYAIECAMDELAAKLEVDPLDLRLKNYADRDQAQDRPFSSKELRACYQVGAERFGWARRTAAPGSMRDGDVLIGWGLATGVWDAFQQKASAKAVLTADGRLTVSSATADIGTGTYTILTQIAAEALGLPLAAVTARLGDSDLPTAPIQGGSWTAASVGSAVKLVCDEVREKVFQLARKVKHSPLADAKIEDLTFADGHVRRTSDPTRAVAIADAMQSGKVERIEEETTSIPNLAKQALYSRYTHSAVFAEVRVDPDFGTVRVSRVVSAVAGGRILNPKTARSQILGSVVWGIGMALEEESVIDHQYGRFMNHSLAEYHVPVNADVRDIDVIFVAERDEIVNPLGAKGLGEIGLVGVAAAIANAVYHATGKRVRDLPITLDKLL